MSHSYSILLAEPNLLLREKIAGILARDERVWSVTQVEGREGLLRSAARSRPDFILADLALLRDAPMLKKLKQTSPDSRIFALVDSLSEPYREACSRMGLDGTFEKGQVGDGLRTELLSLAEAKRDSDAAQP